MARYDPDVVPKPQAIDDEYLSLDDEGCQPDDSPSRLAFFREYIAFCEITMGQMHKLRTLDHHTSENRSPMTFTRYLSDVPQMCLQLDEFLDNLPQHLKRPSSTSTNDCFVMQGLLLKMRFVQEYAFSATNGIADGSPELNMSKLLSCGQPCLLPSGITSPELARPQDPILAETW